LEFGNDALVATGIAMACVTSPIAPELFEFGSEKNSRASGPGLSILEILSLFQNSPTLKPVMPYARDKLFGLALLRPTLQPEDGRVEAIRALCAQFHVDETLGDAEMMAKIEELIWASVLILFATGKDGRKPRLDFFLMHLVTSSLFLRCYINALQNPGSKAKIIKAFLPQLLIISLVRGRPTINPRLLMEATDKPRPPYGAPYKPGKNSIGSPLNDEDYNPWPALIEASIHAPDSHVLKTMRTLVLAAREYGDTPVGLVPGASKQSEGTGANANGAPMPKETHEGAMKLDGSIFVRAAGILMDYMGWTSYGQLARDDWDRSGLGWDDAWNDED